MEIYNFEAMKEMATVGNNVYAIPLPAKTIDDLVTVLIQLENNDVNVTFEGETDLVTKVKESISQDDMTALVKNIYTALNATISIASDGAVYDTRLEMCMMSNGITNYLISADLFVGETVISFFEKFNDIVETIMDKSELSKMNFALIDNSLIMFETVEAELTKEVLVDLSNAVIYAAKKKAFTSSVVMLVCKDVVSIAI